MQIGRLRHRITIQQQTVTRDAYGGETISWDTYATVWAQVTPASGRERFINAGAQEYATVDYKVRIRYRSDIDPKMRISWGTKILDIESVQDPTGYTAELILLCRDVLEGTVA